MGEAQLFLEVFVFVELDDFYLVGGRITSLLTSGRNDPMASLKGYCGRLENPREKMFQGAV